MNIYYYMIDSSIIKQKILFTPSMELFQYALQNIINILINQCLLHILLDKD